MEGQSCLQSTGWTDWAEPCQPPQLLPLQRAAAPWPFADALLARPSPRPCGTSCRFAQTTVLPYPHSDDAYIISRQQVGGGQAGPRGPRGRQVLWVHVWAPPEALGQSLGGTHRVVCTRVAYSPPACLLVGLRQAPESFVHAGPPVHAGYAAYPAVPCRLHLCTSWLAAHSCHFSRPRWLWYSGAAAAGSPQCCSVFRTRLPFASGSAQLEAAPGVSLRLRRSAPTPHICYDTCATSRYNSIDGVV